MIRKYNCYLNAFAISLLILEKNSNYFLAKFVVKNALEKTIKCHETDNIVSRQYFILFSSWDY